MSDAASTLGSMRIVCPLRMDPEAQDGCYRWREFVIDFSDEWPKHFDAPPTLKHWQRARYDWRRASTGWEAVQIAVSLSREKTRKAAEPPPIHIIGKHYATNEHTAALMREKLRALAPPPAPPAQDLTQDSDHPRSEG